MKEIKQNNVLSKNQYLFVPFSESMVLFEDQLVLNNIRFIIETISITKPQIQFTFHEKDIEIVDEILNRIDREALNYEVKYGKIKQQKPLVLKHFEEKLRILFQV